MQTMENLVAPISLEPQKLTLEDKSGKVADDTKRPAPRAGGCRIEGFVRVKKVDLVFKIKTSRSQICHHTCQNILWERKYLSEG